MKRIYLAVIIGALLCLAFSREVNRPELEVPGGGFSGVFAATWLGGFCWNIREHSGKCQKSYFNRWDRQSFTIHGLWPSIPSYTDLILTNFHHKNFNLKQPLFQQMKNYWPPKSSDKPRKMKPEQSQQKDYWLWFHEYQKHGKDYVKVLKTYDPTYYSTFDNLDFQKTYFEAVIRFYESQSLKKINPNAATQAVLKNSYGDLVLTKSQLAQIINIKESQLLVKCRKRESYILQEIHICYRIKNDDHVSIQLASCQSIQGESNYQLIDQCDHTFRMVQYKKTHQIPVTIYEGHYSQGNRQELASQN